VDRNIKLLSFFNFFTDLRFYSAVLILYFTRISGSFALGMSLFSVIFISSAILEIPTGIFSDRIGRKKTIILGASASVVSAIFYAVGISYWFLFAGAVFEGLSRAFYSGNNDALLHDTLKQAGNSEKYSHYLGKLSAMFQLALTLGAAVGSIIANWSFAWIMWLSVLPQIACLIISTRIGEPKIINRQNSNIYLHLKESLKLILSNPKLRLLAVGDILGFGIGESTFEFNSAFIATLWPTWAIGISKMISYIGGGVSYWYSGYLIKKFGGVRIMLFDSIYNRFANLSAVILSSVVSPLILSTTSFLYGVSEVASNGQMQKEFTDEQRATLGSITSFFGSLFFGMFSVILGIVADRFTPAGAMVFAQICSLPRIYILYRLFRHK
jgi:MFS family permease